jgi:hypothetical protein
MEPQGSSPYSQEPATCPYPEPDRSSLCPSPQSNLSKIHFNISSHLRLGLPSGLLPPGFPTKALYAPLLSPIRATCPAHLSSSLDHPNNIWWGVQSIKRVINTRWFKYDQDKLTCLHTNSPGHIWTTLYIRNQILRREEGKNTENCSEYVCFLDERSIRDISTSAWTSQ